MNRSLWVLYIAVLSLVGYASISQAEPGITGHSPHMTARQMIEKYADHFDNQDELTKMEMTLIAKSGGRRIRKMTMKRRTNNEDLDKVLVHFQEPADIRGTSLLTWEQASGSSDLQWIYLPAIRKTKQIANLKKQLKKGT